jgi:ABC-2 type transport system ATP-binding protein
MKVVEIIKIVNLRKTYDKTVALDEFTLTVASGQLFGLVGPDGAGKTTMLRILCGLVEADSGTCIIDGHNVATQTTEVRNFMGYMPQRFSLYLDLTVSENLRFFADLFHVPSKERENRLQRLLRFSRLDPFQKRRAAALSGGMKQKLALSCTLIHTPKILFLDEPTTGVDPVSRQEFWEILTELRNEGVTLLVTTPYMDEAAKCDRVAFMHKGRILAEANPEEIPNLSRQHFLELRCSSLNQAAQIIRGIDCIHTVLALGDRIHLCGKNITTMNSAVAQRLHAAGISIESLDRVTPSIEDVFVELMGE